MSKSQPERMVAKYGRCPVCDMALWPDGSCTLPLHTAEKMAAIEKTKAQVKVEVRRGKR